MELILSGGGSGEQTKELDKKFAEIIDKSKPLLYIPIAIDTKKHPYSECIKWLRSTFDKFGVDKYEMWVEEDLKKYKAKNPENFAGIYIGGGNTPYLLKTLKKSGIWEWLRNAANTIPIYGGSAGAIIFARTIIPSLSADANEVGLTDFSAMNLIDNWEIWCHYDNENKKKIIRDYIEKYQFKGVIALSEETGLFINKDNIKVIGKRNAYVFKNNKEIEVKIGDNLK